MVPEPKQDNRETLLGEKLHIPTYCPILHGWKIWERVGERPPQELRDQLPTGRRQQIDISLLASDLIHYPHILCPPTSELAQW